MTLVEWLESCGLVNVAPCKVTIGKQVFEGAYAERVNYYQPGMDAVTRGERRVGESYLTRYFYLLGHLPKTYQKSSHECYVWEGNPHEWYVGSYSTDVSDKGFHPFGHSFMVMPWDCSGKVDDHAEKPYRRVPMVVEWTPA